MVFCIERGQVGHLPGNFLFQSLLSFIVDFPIVEQPDQVGTAMTNRGIGSMLEPERDQFAAKGENKRRTLLCQPCVTFRICSRSDHALTFPN